MIKAGDPVNGAGTTTGQSVEFVLFCMTSHSYLRKRLVTRDWQPFLRQPGRLCTSFSTDERLSHLEDRARSHSRPWSQHRQPPTATTTLDKIRARRCPSRNFALAFLLYRYFSALPRSQCIHLAPEAVEFEGE